MGNSRLKWAAWEAGRPLSSGAVALDEIATLAHAWADLSPEGVFAVSVTPQAMRDAVSALTQRLWGQAICFIDARAACCGLSNAYDDVASLGADRWAAMIGAHKMSPDGFFVVDCGTAVTIDAVDRDGHFCGGVILAGLGLARAALTRGTAQLGGAVGHGRSTETVLATTTTDAIDAGTLHGLAGGIEHIISRQRMEMSDTIDHDAPVYLCGGDAERMTPLLKTEVSVVPDLVIQGLALMAQEGAC